MPSYVSWCGRAQSSWHRIIIFWSWRDDSAVKSALLSSIFSPIVVYTWLHWIIPRFLSQEFLGWAKTTKQMAPFLNGFRWKLVIRPGTSPRTDTGKASWVYKDSPWAGTIIVIYQLWPSYPIIHIATVPTTDHSWESDISFSLICSSSLAQ